MAGRFGFLSSSPETSMIVTNTPAAELALTNLAYCCPSDLQNFSIPGTRLYLASVGDSFVLSVSYPFLVAFLLSIFESAAVTRVEVFDLNRFSCMKGRNDVWSLVSIWSMFCRWCKMSLFVANFHGIYPLWQTLKVISWWFLEVGDDENDMSGKASG